MSGAADCRAVMVFRYSAVLPRLRMAADFYCQEFASPGAAPPLRLSLLCPVSRRRQAMPVRTKACTHVQTLDLATVIEALPEEEFRRKAQRLASPRTVDHEFLCPLCRSSGSLYTDTVVAQALDALPDTVTTVTIYETGEVVPVSSSKPSVTAHLAKPPVILPSLLVEAGTPGTSTPGTSTPSTSGRLVLGKLRPLVPGRRKKATSPQPAKARRASCSSPRWAAASEFGERCLARVVGSRYEKLGSPVGSPC